MSITEDGILLRNIGENDKTLMKPKDKNQQN